MNPPIASDVSYTQFAQLPHIVNKSNTPEELREAAEHFESLFIDMWLKASREANESLVTESFLNSNEMKMHQQMLDHEMSVHLAKNGGIGLADVIVRQLQGQTPIDTAAQTQPALLESAETPIPIKKTAHRVAAFGNAEEFVNKLRPIIDDVLDGRSLPARSLPAQGILSQAALETGWGNKVIAAQDGELSHNLFGIKAKSNEEPGMEISSMEFELGRWTTRLSNFRNYDSWHDSIAHYVEMISSDPRYQSVMDAGGDIGRFAESLATSGYATDPGYAEKLLAVAKRLEVM